MAVDIRFLGQSCFELKAGDATVLTDPFLTGNPKAAATADEVDPDFILLTHGHGDHLGDTVDIAKRTGATVVAIVELANEIAGGGRRERRRPELRRHRRRSTGAGSSSSPPGTPPSRRAARRTCRPAC